MAALCSITPVGACATPTGTVGASPPSGQLVSMQGCASKSNNPTGFHYICTPTQSSNPLSGIICSVGAPPIQSSNPTIQTPGLTGALPTSSPTLNNPIVGGASTLNTPTSTPAPCLGVTTGAHGGCSILQGKALPCITTKSSQVTAAPKFYTDFLNNIATAGACVAANAHYVGATPLQQAAWCKVAACQGNYKGALCAAKNVTTGVQNACLNQQAQKYMSPYVHCVVNQIGALGQANIMNNVGPQANAGIVGSGQFGSTRGATALGQVLSNAALGLTAQQSCALQKGYTQALCTAKSQENMQLAAANQGICEAKTTQALSLNCANAMATMGAQQQTIAQNAQCYPMKQLVTESNLLKGYSIPESTSSSYTGPIPGAYSASLLQQLTGAGALAKGLMCAYKTYKCIAKGSGGKGGGSGGGGGGCKGGGCKCKPSCCPPPCCPPSCCEPSCCCSGCCSGCCSSCCCSGGCCG